MRLIHIAIFALPILYYLTFEEFKAVQFNLLFVVCGQSLLLFHSLKKKFFSENKYEEHEEVLKEKPYYLLPDDEIIPDSMVWIIDKDNQAIERYLAAITYTLIKGEVEVCYWLSNYRPTDIMDIKQNIHNEHFYESAYITASHKRPYSYPDKIKAIYKDKDLSDVFIQIKEKTKVFQTKQQANEAIADKLRNEADKLLDKSNELLS